MTYCEAVSYMNDIKGQCLDNADYEADSYNFCFCHFHAWHHSERNEALKVLNSEGKIVSSPHWKAPMIHEKGGR
jgi:hypothetical protein